MHPIAEFAVNYGLFLAKVVTLVAAVGLLAAWIAGLAVQARRHRQDNLKILHVNDRLEQMSATLHAELLNDVEHKALKKRKKEEAKQRKKAEKLGKRHSAARLFVLDFDGDIRASAVDGLARVDHRPAAGGSKPMTKSWCAWNPGGGMVHSYGLAASQLARLRDRGSAADHRGGPDRGQRRLYDGLRGRSDRGRAVRHHRLYRRNCPDSEPAPPAQGTTTWISRCTRPASTSAR